MTSNDDTTTRPRHVRSSALALLLAALFLTTAGCRSVGSRSTWDLLKHDDMGWRGLSQTFDLFEGGTGFEDVGRTWSLMQQGPEGGLRTVWRDSSFLIEPFSFQQLRSTFRHLR